MDIVEEYAKYIVDRVLKEGLKIEVVDYCCCLRYTYVRLRIDDVHVLGLAYTPIEDISQIEDVGEIPNLTSIVNQVKSLKALDRSLAIAYLNAISQYLINIDNVKLVSCDVCDLIENRYRG